MRKMGIGLQMYTLRDETAADFAGTLRKVAELGYEGVEFAGFGGLSAEELRSLLQETGLQAIGAHVSVQALEEDLRERGAVEQARGVSVAVQEEEPSLSVSSACVGRGFGLGKRGQE